MRIVHVASRLAAAAAFAPALQALAVAQAKANSGRVLVVAPAATSAQTRAGDAELRTFPGERPRWFGRSRALRQYLVNCPLELIHAHCPGERGLHYAHLAAQRHGAPLVVSPGLAFGLGAGERLRPRCTFARFLIHPQALETAAGWHAANAEEASAIRACGFRQPICIAPPGLPAPSAAELAQARTWWHGRHPRLAERPVALCLAGGRGLNRLRELIALWGDSFTSDWILLVVGPAGARATRQLTAHAARHRAADRVLVATADKAPPPYAVARLLLGVDRESAPLATVATALATGLPALVADDAPWSRLEPDGAGWCVPWKNFGPALRHALELGPDRLVALGRTAQELARREFDWTHSAETLLAFYRNLRR